MTPPQSWLTPSIMTSADVHGKGRGWSSPSPPGYFYSWERRWWTWTRGLETFLRQLTKAVKWEPELRRPQISSFKCVTGNEPRRAVFPRKEFPWFCPNRQIKSPRKVLVTHWCRKLKQMLRTQKHLQPCWRTQLQGVKAGHWDTDRLWHANLLPSRTRDFWKRPNQAKTMELCWFISDEDGSLENQFQVSCVELPRSCLPVSLSLSLSIPYCQNASKWRFTGSTEWFPQEESFHTCLPNKQSAVFRNQIGHCWQL